MEIRPLTKEDMEDYKIIDVSAYTWKFEDYYKSYPKFSEYYNIFVNSEYAFILVNDDGKKCGVIIGYEKPDVKYGKTMFIENIAVLPEEQGKGYGKALIYALEKAALKNKIPEISLRTGCYMNSYLIYRHLGFKDQRSDSRYMTRIIKNIEPEQTESNE